MEEESDLQSPAIGKCMANFPFGFVQIKMEADPRFPFNDVEFSLLPNIL